MTYTYLASPYSHEDEAVRELRFKHICTIAGDFMTKGKVVYSPIAHGHAIAMRNSDVPKLGWNFWEKQCLTMLKFASKLVVVMLPGWDTSQGVTAEIREAERLGIPVTYFHPDGGNL